VDKVRILFLCGRNSCRSQMAEGWTRHLKGEEVEVESAGLQAGGVDPRAVRVMAEAGVDLTGQRSKRWQDLEPARFDFVITLCDEAHEACPLPPPGTRLLHRGFPDPPRLAREAGSEEEALEHYRRVRDQIRQLVESLPGSLG